MSYNLETFLKPLTESDKNIQIRDTALLVKWTINPFTIKNIIVANNLIRISLNSDRVVTVDFRTSNEAKQAIILLESAVEVLRNKAPLFIDKVISEYIQSVGLTGSQGPQGFQGTNGTIGIDGATGPAGGGTSSISSTQSSPADPATTTSATGVMMGLAVPFTPSSSGKLLFLVSGDIDNNTNNRGASFQLRTGTGTAPVNGAALTGTTRGPLYQFFNNNLNERNPFSINFIASGYTISTAIWLDLSLAVVGGVSTARIRNLSISILEI